MRERPAALGLAIAFLCTIALIVAGYFGAHGYSLIAGVLG